MRKKLAASGALVVLIGGLWVGLRALPDRSPNERKQIADLFDRAEGSEAKGRLAAAEAAYREALGVAERIGEEKAELGARIGLARLAVAFERLAEAAGFLRPALALATRLREADRTAIVQNNLGEVARAQGRYAEATHRFREALAVPDLSDKTRAAVLNNLGEVARAQGRYAEALGAYQESLGLNERLQYKPGLAANLANIGAVHLAQGRAGEAVRWLERSHRAAFEAGDPLALPPILTTLSQAYAAAGNAEDAVWSLVDARDQYLLMGLESRAAVLTREIERLREGEGPPVANARAIRPAPRAR